MIHIVEITRIGKINKDIWVKRLSPDPSDDEIKASITTPLPLSQEGAGIYSKPEIQPGVKCVATRYQGEYLILGFFSDYNPTFGQRSNIDIEEPLESGDINIRNASGNRVSILRNGRIELFSNLWARINISQKIQQLSLFFKELKINWFGGKILASEDIFKAVISKGFDNPTTSDIEYDTEETSPSVITDTYIDKVILSNIETPFKLETRQQIGVIGKDTFNIERWGRGEDGLNWYLKTIDNIEHVSSLQASMLSGLIYQSKRTQAIIGQNNGDWLSRMHLGDKASIEFVSNNNLSKFSLSDNENSMILTTNDGTISFGKDFVLSRNNPNGFSIIIDEEGTLNINTPYTQIVTDKNNNLFISVNPNGKIYIGNTELKFGAGADGVLTAKSVFGIGGSTVDTFTGLPFIGSSSVVAKD